jgi:phosphohistidine swiveling domain-containing protein
MKKMMTGEWNISDTDKIRATAVQRKLDYQAWQKAGAGDLLVGDCTAFAVLPSGALGLPGAAGTGHGEVVTAPAGLAEPALRSARGKVVLVGVQADAGWAAALPATAGIVQAQGSPLDPVVAAAAALHVPVLYGLGERVGEVQAQPMATVDGSQGTVTNGR